MRIPNEEEPDDKPADIESYGNLQSQDERDGKVIKKTTTQNISSVLNGIKTKFIK